jgi:hypothetical protein
VCLLELHDAAASPGTVARRAWIPVDSDDSVPSPGKGRADGEAGRACTHDDDIHGLSFNYIHNGMNTLTVQPNIATDIPEGV